MNDFQKEVMKYSRALEKILKQYTGLDLKLMEDDLLKSGNEINLNIGLFKR